MWTSNKMIAIYILAAFCGIAVISWLVLRKTVRTRLRMQRTIRDDPDINDWLIAFDWTPKILYVPAFLVSFMASLLMFLKMTEIPFLKFINPELIGGVWFLVFFFNFLIEEYNISIKVLLIAIVSFGFFLLWLHLLGWVSSFFKLFTNLALSISAAGYLIIGIIGMLTILISWLNGLFYYVTITPNYLNLQQGPTETGEQIGREDYNTRIDTSDFLERLLGFGRIVIIFRDKKREPISLLVYNIQKKALLLERVRGKFAIDLQPQSKLSQE